MHGLILAGGTGSRLAADGVDGPKAAVAIAGRPQLVRLVGTLHELGCPSITCMLRDNAGDATTRTAHAMRALLDGVAELGSTAVRVVPCRTPSSLHTLVDGLATVPPGDVFCTMVDTVMRNRDWHLVYATATDLLAAGADAVLAVTPFVDDERPLWVERDTAGVVRRLGDAPVSPPCVTGGVYAFGAAARAEAARARREGISRMRGFLSRLVDEGARVATVEVTRIVDVDRRQDLELANAWLGAEDE
jgi:molybdopterin-guanine dinucleotide biosynthesis protein A